MSDYVPPLKDMRFVIKELIGLDQFAIDTHTHGTPTAHDEFRRAVHQPRTMLSRGPL